MIMTDYINIHTVYIIFIENDEKIYKNYIHILNIL